MREKAELLIEAIRIKDVEQIKRNLAEGTKINQKTTCFVFSTPLFTAIYTQDLNIVKLLFEYSRIENEYDSKIQYAFHYAFKQGNLDIIQYLLEQYPELLINDTDPKTLQTPLYIATENKHIHVLKFLISQGVNVNAYCTKYKRTALHKASALGSLEMVNLLLENKAEVNASDELKQFPLHQAITNGHNEVAKVLIRAGTDLNQLDFNSCTVLFEAVQKIMIDVVEDLIQFGADVLKVNCLMHVAISKKSLDMVRILHHAGFPLAMEDDYEDTPFMIACYYGHFSIAEYLLKNGASPNKRRERTGRTAFYYCIEKIENPDLFKKFLELHLEYNVSFEEQYIQNENAFSYAMDNHNFMVTSTLIKYGFDVNYIEESWLKDHFITTRNHGFCKIMQNLDGFIKLLICAGFNFKNFEDFKDVDVDIFKFIAYSMSRPRCLKDICRIKLRKLLGKKVLVKLYKLEIPKRLHDFLALDIL